MYYEIIKSTTNPPNLFYVPVWKGIKPPLSFLCDGWLGTDGKIYWEGSPQILAAKERNVKKLFYFKTRDEAANCFTETLKKLPDEQLAAHIAEQMLR